MVRGKGMRDIARVDMFVCVRYIYIYNREREREIKADIIY